MIKYVLLYKHGSRVNFKLGHPHTHSLIDRGKVLK